MIRLVAAVVAAFAALWVAGMVVDAAHPPDDVRSDLPPEWR